MQKEGQSEQAMLDRALAGMKKSHEHAMHEAAMDASTVATAAIEHRAKERHLLAIRDDVRVGTGPTRDSISVEARIG
jgi:hypothetical protein